MEISIFDISILLICFIFSKELVVFNDSIFYHLLRGNIFKMILPLPF